MYIPDVHEYGEEHDIAKQFLTEEDQKKFRDEIGEIVEAELDRFVYGDVVNRYISDLAAQRAEAFLAKVLHGKENAAMVLLGDRSGGSRYRDGGYDAGKPWASLIHGRLFETDQIQLRRQIVEAHADLLRSERIKDLESIVDGLTQQVRQQDAEIARLRGW